MHHKPFGSLRPLENTDARQVLDWRNSDHVRKHMVTQEEIAWEGHQKWVAKVVSQPEDCRYFIYEVEGQPMGVIGFYAFTPEKHAEWGLYIGATNAPKGAGESMCRLALTWFFNEFNGETLETFALKTNAKAIALYEKLGFTAIDKGAQTHHYMSLSRKNWLDKTKVE